MEFGNEFLSSKDTVHIQWRRQDFVRGGGTPRPIKGYHALPQGVRGAAAPGR